MIDLVLKNTETEFALRRLRAELDDKHMKASKALYEAIKNFGEDSIDVAVAREHLKFIEFCIELEIS